MKKIKMLASALFTFALLLNSPTIFAQNGKIQQLKAIKKSKRENAHKNGNRVEMKDKLNPAQRERIEQKRAAAQNGEKAAKPGQKLENHGMEKSGQNRTDQMQINKRGNVENKQNQQTGTPLTKDGLRNKKGSLSKAKTIAKINMGKGRVKAGDEKLARAKAKLQSMKNSGQLSSDQIKKKETVIARYEEHLIRLKKTLTKGNEQITN